MRLHNVGLGLMTAFTGWALIFSGTPTRAQTSMPPVTAPAPPPAPAPLADDKTLTANLVYKFTPAVFGQPQFPHGSFEQDALVNRFFAPVNVTTTFYNAKYQEVKQADVPGRYGAVVDIHLGNGMELHRFITLYRSPAKIYAWTPPLDIAVKFPLEWGIDPIVAHEQQHEIGDGMKQIFVDGMSQGSAPSVLLSALSETPPGAPPAIHRTGPAARDAAWWYGLRQQIGLPESYAYLVDLPAGYDADPNKRWPLILFLHGSGERGDDLKMVRKHGLAKLMSEGKQLPAIVVSPQCPAGEWWKTPVLSALLDEVEAKYRVDPDRIYLTGLSMGGFGSWNLSLTDPGRFAAVVPICGGGDPPDAARLKHIPIWAFHGEKDDTVPVSLTVDMVEALRQAGGKPHLTLFPDAGHDSWTQAYAVDALYPWLLAQKRGQPEVTVPGVPKP